MQQLAVECIKVSSNVENVSVNKNRHRLYKVKQKISDNERCYFVRIT